MQKKIFITIIFFIIFNFSLSLQIKSNLDSTSSCISVSIEIPNLNIEQKNETHFITFSESKIYAEKNKPQIPTKTIFLLIPYEKEIEKIEIVSSEKIKIEGQYNLENSSGPIPLSFKNNFSSHSTICEKSSQQVPLINSFYPEEIIKPASLQIMQGYKLLPLIIFGALYNQATKELIWIKKINFKIFLKNSKSLISFSPYNQTLKQLVSNQEIFSTYSPLQKLNNIKKYYLIITTNEMKNAFLDLLDFKKTKEFEGELKIIEEIHNENGFDLPEKIRNYIKKCYQEKKEYQIFVLLGGDVWRYKRNPENDTAIIAKEELIPTRIIEGKVTGTVLVDPVAFKMITKAQGEDDKNVLKNSTPVLTDTPASGGHKKPMTKPTQLAFESNLVLEKNEFKADISCDLYYSCLDDSWGEDKNKNGILEIVEMNANIDLLPEIYIGRAPVDTLEQAQNFVNKIKIFETSSREHLKKALFLCYRFDDINDSISIAESIQKEMPQEITIFKRYESTQELAPENVFPLLSEVGIFNHTGHANLSGFGSIYSNNLFSLQLNKTRNYLSPSSNFYIFNSCGCYTTAFQEDPFKTNEEIKIKEREKTNDSQFYLFDDCISEELLLNPKSGAIACIGNSSYGLYDETNAQLYSGEYQMEFYNQYIRKGITFLGEILSKSKIPFVPYSGPETPYLWIQFCLNLLGDPSLELTLPQEKIQFSGINFPNEKSYFQITQKKQKFNLIISLKNFTLQNITNIQATISTNDKYTSIIKNTANFTLSNNNEFSNQNDSYVLEISPDCPYEYKICFKLNITSSGYNGEDIFSLSVINFLNAMNEIKVYPNPCNLISSNALNFINIPYNSNAKISIYNLAGELVRVLKENVEIKEDNNRKLTPRVENCFWDKKNQTGILLEQGIYLYIIECNQGIKKGKIALIKK
ncbi:MAG: C25 family cysteine peptidase [bacterium]